MNTAWSAHRTCPTLPLAILVACLTVPIAEAQGLSGDLPAQFQAIAAPVIVGRLDAPAAIAVGRGVLQPAQGAPVYVLSANGKPCGVLIDGPASLLYRVEDRFSLPLARRNLRKADGITVSEADSGLRVSVSLRGAAVWAWDLDIGPWTAQQNIAAPPWLAETMERRRSPNPARDMLLAAWNGGGRLPLGVAAGNR